MNGMNEQKKHGVGRSGGLHLVLGGLLGALAMPACANHVSVPAEIATCPCANGAFCCSSGVCAADATGCDVATAALSSSVEGEWQGYFENFTLSTDDSLAISIVVADDGTMSGHVTVGQVPAPAAPIDPDAVWPPGLVADNPADVLPPYVPGFAYSAMNIHWEAERLQFEIVADDAWQGWCALQTAYANSEQQVLTVQPYNCVPSPGQCFSNISTTDDVPCFKAYLLCTDNGPCLCDATDCRAKTSGPSYSFDIALRDGIGDGSTSLTGGNIRLTQTSGP